jgi:hypothetical protein
MLSTFNLMLVRRDPSFRSWYVILIDFRILVNKQIRQRSAWRKKNPRHVPLLSVTVWNKINPFRGKILNSNRSKYLTTGILFPQAD